MGHFAVGDEAVVNDVVVLDLLSHLALEIERLGGGEEARIALAGGADRSVDLIEDSALRIEIVSEARGVDILFPGGVGKMDAAARYGFGGLPVVIHFVRGEDHPLPLDFD